MPTMGLIAQRKFQQMPTMGLIAQRRIQQMSTTSLIQISQAKEECREDQILSTTGLEHIHLVPLTRKESNTKLTSKRVSNETWKPWKLENGEQVSNVVELYLHSQKIFTTVVWFFPSFSI